jgi:hypothetical protein
MNFKEWAIVIALMTIAISIRTAHAAWFGLQKIFLFFPRIFSGYFDSRRNK